MSATQFSRKGWWVDEGPAVVMERGEDAQNLNRQCAGEWQEHSVKLFFANVTAWSSKVRMYLESMQDVVLWAVVEHGLRGSKLEEERVWLHQRGWKCTAVTSTTEGKAVGGAAILTRSDAVEATGGFAGGAGYSFVSSFVWLERVEVLVVALYLKSGEHLESVTNKPLLIELASSLRMLKVPWMVLADWNQPPSVLKEHWFLEAVKGELVVTNSATIASGNELDYVVVSKHLYGAVATSVEHAVPWAPHYGVNVVLSMRPRQWSVPVLSRFMRFPQCFGPRLPWARFHVQNVQQHMPCEVHVVNQDARLNNKYADFMHQFESWKYSVATDIKEDDLGRGRCLTIKHQLKMPRQSSGEVWKDGKVGFWQSLHRWVVEITNLKQDRKSVAHRLTLWKKIREAADKLPKYWRPLDKGVSMVSLQFGLRTVLDLSRDLLDSVLATVEAVGKLELQQVHDAQQQRLEEWRERATAGSAKIAHRYLKKPSELPERPFDHVKFDERPAKRREYWVNLWGEAELKHELSPQRVELKARAIEQARELKAISSAQIRQTLMHVPNKKEGIDGITFQDLKEMPDEAISNLTWLYHEIEATGHWPQNVQHVAIALLPKNSKAERPIGLLATVYRLWAKMRRFLVVRWARECRHYAPWDFAREHSTVFDVACMRQARGEMSGALKTEQISLLADLEHFYDCINVDVLVTKGLELRFPALLLHHSVIFHEGPRILCADGMASQPIRPAKGLVAGDPFSVYLAKVQLHDILHSLYFDYYRVPRMVTSWVDDLGVDVFHFDEEQVVKEACEVSELLAQRLQDEGLKLSIKKTGFLCSSARLAKKLKAELAQRNSRLKVEVVLKDLGLDCTLGRRRIVKQQRVRRQRGLSRLWKMRIFPKRQRNKLLKTNVMPTALWGHQQMGFPQGQLRVLRARMARAAGVLKSVGYIEVAMLLGFTREQDPLFLCRRQHVEMFIKLYRNLTSGQRSTLDKVWRIEWQFLGTVRYPWMHVKGPIRAMIAILIDLGWSVPRLSCWIDDLGEEFPCVWSDPYSVCCLWQSMEQTICRQQAEQLADSLKTVRLRDGFDIAVVKKMRAKICKHAPDEVGLFDSMVQGTLQGLAHATQECACGENHQDPDDMFHHWLWECPLVLKELGHPAPDWYLHHRKPEQWCFWHFGVVPNEWTCLPPLLDDVECSGIFVESWPVELEPGVILATDGSGGPFSSNPRKRQCACAVVAVVCREGVFVEVGSLVANVAGGCEQQTVPRAEAVALQLALEATTSRHGLTVAVDAKYVVQRFRTHDQFVPLNCKNADVWGRIQVRRSQHEHVQLSKVKSHLSREVFVEQFGADTLLQWFGNQRADAYATARAVALAQNAKPHYVYLDWLDRRTEAVAKWLWKATKFHLQSKQQLVRKPYGPRKATRAELVRDSQLLSPTHFWTHYADGSGQCFWCKLRLKRLDSCAALRAKLTLPCICPGGQVNLPVLMSLGVHRSHSFQIRGQQLYCEQCCKQRPVHRLGVFRRGCPKEGRRR